MMNIKPTHKNIAEIFITVFIYSLILFNVLFFKDSVIAACSAFFGITYTILAGKGKPACYIFGITGSGFYAYLAFINALWGNLALYLGYYIPMQILGFIKWNKHLKSNKNEIIKTSLTDKNAFKLVIISILGCIICYFILLYCGDKNPIADSITTVLSLTGMYLTVKRCIEQWIAWMIVNGISVYMWGDILLKGEKVYSTVLMWCVYFLLAICFYIDWKKELSQSRLNKF